MSPLTRWRQPTSVILFAIVAALPFHASASRVIASASSASAGVTLSVNVVAAPASSSAAAELPSFTKDLSFGIIDPQVKLLQQYLNTYGFPVASTGMGSPGHETNYFGNATQAAMVRFQSANHITPPSGYFGPITRAYIQSHKGN